MSEIAFIPDQEFIDLANDIVSKRYDLLCGAYYKSKNKKYTIKIMASFRSPYNELLKHKIRVGHTSGNIEIVHDHLIDKETTDDILLFEIYWCLCKFILVKKYGYVAESDMMADSLVLDYFKNNGKKTNKLIKDVIFEISINESNPQIQRIQMLNFISNKSKKY